MRSKDDLAQAVIAALNSDDRINWAEADVSIVTRGSTVVLTGKVGRLADRRRLFNDALQVAGVKKVEDRLSIEVTPSRPDSVIRQHVLDALEQDRWLDPQGIRVSVNRGVVRLEGEVESLLRKRLAGAAAWWVAGTRDVINDLRVLYPEPDSADQIIDACETELEKDPFVDHTEVLVRARAGVVTLLGTVCSQAEKRMAEDDCWYILGVKDVVNKLAVVPGEGLERPEEISSYNPPLSAPSRAIRRAVSPGGRSRRKTLQERGGDMAEQAGRSEEEIRRDVRDALVADARVDESGINVDIADGTVYFTGVVPTAAQKMIARDIADRIKGVLNVVNELQVSPLSVRSDIDIQRDVEAALQGDPLVDERRIQVRVDEGIVYLSGTVEDLTDRVAAEEAARRVKGVMEVVDDIAVVA